MTDFTAFRFGNVHTRDLNLLVVSTSNRYNKNALPDLQDYTVDVPGGDGKYYFGQTFSTQEFTCEIAFDSVDEKTWRKISNLFSTDKLLDLVFDELPYKTYRAKIKNKPEFKFICFRDRDTGDRVYKGEGTLNFICYYPYAFGFNKYLVRSSDYYLTTPPETIIKTHTKAENPYAENIIEPIYKHTREYYNVENNMEQPWKGGYPTFEQVERGELFFHTPNGKKSLIEVRGYWDNLPEWSPSSRLLTTPTLDFDQELIFLPQYSKVQYINMDIGLNKDNCLMGSRILVYNPGDLPVDFKLKLDNNDRTFWTSRGNHFQIRRHNVERLTIQEAVDWTGLKPEKVSDEEAYKYGNKYFKLTSKKLDGETNLVDYEELGSKHPNHAYVVEPIPKEQLGHFIRMFYWQSAIITSGEIDYEEGNRIADRYEELFDLTIIEEEKQELYWKTLKKAILSNYAAAAVFNDSEYTDENYTYDDFVYDYIYNPPEYIRKNNTLNYGEFDFNINTIPQYYTQDYLEIKTDDITNATLYLDTDKRMLYNINKSENRYDYKPTKTIYNENIVKGRWFKIPVGWSLIEIAPVCDEDVWGGKRWLDARPFDWGYGGNANGDKTLVQEFFDEIYYKIAKQYLESNNKPAATKEEIIQNINFRSWYSNQIEKIKNPATSEIIDNFAYEVYMGRRQKAEYGFLKLLHLCWLANKGKKDESGNLICGGEISEWWWYACNYIWANFPPLYWAYADLLNDLKIDYVPLFY